MLLFKTLTSFVAGVARKELQGRHAVSVLLIDGANDSRLEKTNPAALHFSSSSIDSALV